MKRIKKGDTVIVIAGKDKKKLGTVLKVSDLHAVVEGINIVKKHVKPNPKENTPGGIHAKEMPIHISNLALYNEVTKKADRVGFQFIEKAGVKYKVRYFKSNKEIIDNI